MHSKIHQIHSTGALKRVNSFDTEMYQLNVDHQPLNDNNLPSGAMLVDKPILVRSGLHLLPHHSTYKGVPTMTNSQPFEVTPLLYLEAARSAEWPTNGDYQYLIDQSSGDPIYDIVLESFGH